MSMETAPLSSIAAPAGVGSHARPPAGIESTRRPSRSSVWRTVDHFQQLTKRDAASLLPTNSGAITTDVPTRPSLAVSCAFQVEFLGVRRFDNRRWTIHTHRMTPY